MLGFNFSGGKPTRFFVKKQTADSWGAIQTVALSIRISLSCSTVDGNPFQKCFAFPLSMETPFQKCFAFPPETAVGAIQTVALRIKLILPARA
ncbi:MAG: hypothetical protein LBL04_14900 [Bacteroidales bacterium]|nr:hypothetical protein [Bacteroidales bacterium]